MGFLMGGVAFAAQHRFAVELGTETFVGTAFPTALLATFALAQALPRRPLGTIRAWLFALAFVTLGGSPLAGRVLALLPTDPAATGLSLALRGAFAIGVAVVLGVGFGLAVPGLEDKNRGRLWGAVATGATAAALLPARFVWPLVLLAIWVAGRVHDGLDRGRAPESAERRDPVALAPAAIAGLALLAALPLTLRLVALERENERPDLPVAIGLAFFGLGALQGSRRESRAIATVGALVALVTSVVVLKSAPSLLESGWVVLALVAALASLATGAALGTAARLAPRATSLAAGVAVLAASVMAPALVGPASRSWSEADRAWIALGAPLGERANVPGLLASGALSLRSFEVGSEGVVAVVDSKAGNARELRRDGHLLGSVAVGSGDTQADLTTPLLAAILAETLAPHGGHVAVLGFGDGIAAGTIANVAGLSDLFLVEPDDAIRALRSDPGDLFHGAWNESRATIVPEDPLAFLARTKLALSALLDLEGALEAPARLERAREHVTPGGALVRVVHAGPSFAAATRAFAAVYPQALAFHSPRATDAVILVGGVAPLESTAFTGLEDKREPLAQRLALTKIPPRHILGTWAAGAGGLARATTPAELLPTPDDVLALERFFGVADTAPLETLASRPSPRAQTTLVKVADSAGKLGFHGVARSILGALSDRRADSVEVIRGLGDVAYHEGKDAEAVKLWNDALAADPRAISPRVSLAVRHLKRKELGPARQVVDVALSGEPARDAPVHFLLGQIAFEEQDYTLAKEEYQKAVGFEDAAYRVEVATQLEQEKSSLAGTPKHAPVNDKDAATLAREGRRALDAVDTDERDLTHDLALKGLVPGDKDLALFRSRRELARDRLEAAAAKAPNDPQVCYDLGRARATLGDRDGARLAFENAAQLDPANGRPLLALGDLLRDAGQDNAALDAYQRGLARGPITSASARAYLACADILKSKGELDDAARTLEEADRLAPGHPAVIVNLGYFYEQLHRPQDAIRAYERWIDVVGEGGDPAERQRVEAAMQRLQGQRSPMQRGR